MSEQTELEKAIEELEALKPTVNWYNFTGHASALGKVLSAAKQLSALEAKCAEMEHALRCANNSFVGSPDGQKQIDKALSSTCGQNYIHKDKVREIVRPMKNCAFFLRDYLKTTKHPGVSRMLGNLADSILDAKAEGLIE